MGGISSTVVDVWGWDGRDQQHSSGCVGARWAGSAAQAAGTTSNANGDLAVNLCYLFMSIATETTRVFSPHLKSFFKELGRQHFSVTAQSKAVQRGNPTSVLLIGCLGPSQADLF